ncbi:hypothetical protein Tfer_2057 [Thermincola ferriacetica]|uniref:Uncharacterized protein n=2 Tax=Thermincola TaxID=278993 RepID=D5XE25_THEPJ|nr:hypothetical protein TherJR_1031 [Thermincola potens JR]KNZ69260.1 hypothetical protein Tfer_2057 [Thermincola ferriacetica]
MSKEAFDLFFSVGISILFVVFLVQQFLPNSVSEEEKDKN